MKTEIDYKEILDSYGIKYRQSGENSARFQDRE